MSASKLIISEKLIEGNVKAPPSLKEQAITKLAIQICQNNELKRDIIYESEPLRRWKCSVSNRIWNNLIKKRSTNICEKLPLPSATKNQLMVRIMSIALQLFNWNRQQVEFDFSPLFADSLLIPSDWTAEMRLDETKIAERLVQDGRISVTQRYKMACWHCLPLFIHSLWEQMSLENHEHFLHHEESTLVQLWSYKSAGRVEEYVNSDEEFWYHVLRSGVWAGSRSTVFQCWDKLSINLKQTVPVEIAILSMRNIQYTDICDNSDMWMYVLLPFPVQYIDILCFLLTQMSEVQIVDFFQGALKFTNVLIQLMRWPYLDLLIPIIKKLWKILPDTRYEDLLLTLAYRYSESLYVTVDNRGGYVDYNYGEVMIALLDETPDHFKRYVFSNNYHRHPHSVERGKLLFTVIQKNLYQIRNIKIFQHLWQHVTPEERKSFLRSKYGGAFCAHLVGHEKLELLNSILRECIAEEDISIFKKHILRSEKGKVACFAMLENGDEEALNSWLNWGFTSKQEIFKFILKLFFRNKWFLFKEISDVGFEINCLDNIIQKYAPTEDARKKFKTQFVKKHARDACAHFIYNSKSKEIDPFLFWCFPSECDRKRFKKWFVSEYAMKFCEYHLCRSNLQDAEQLLTWCFTSEESRVQFRQELLFFSGVMLQQIVYFLHFQDLDMLIKWFRLNPVAILKFKKEVLFCSYSLDYIFEYMSKFRKLYAYKGMLDEIPERVGALLRWGLADEETAMSFKDVSEAYLMDFSFSTVKVRQLVEQYWNKLMKEILIDLSRKRKDTSTKCLPNKKFECLRCT